MKAYPIALSLALLAGCSSAPSNDLSKPAQSVNSFYDYQLYSPQGLAVSLSSLPVDLKSADVILIGEWHTHSGVHRFQTDLLKQLVNNNAKLALSMEQFTRDKQPIVDQYLKSEIGEQMLIREGNAWPNYESDYRPLVELAKQNQLDIIASNAPKSFVRCIGREGLNYLEKLDSNERTLVAKRIDTSSSAYKDKFMASMHHGDSEQTERQYAAQLTWDATMAESIVDYINQHPGTQVMHIAGKFHTENALGTAAQIQALAPNLNIAVITPVTDITSDSRDFQLSVLAPPVRYVQKENQMQAYKHLHKRSDTLTCD